MRLFLWLPTVAAALVCASFRKAGRETDSPAILIVRLDGLGDSVMTLPLLEQLRQRYPNGQITVVTQPQAEAVFRLSGDVDEVIVLHPSHTAGVPLRARRLFAAISLFHQSLRKRAFDIVSSPRWDVDSYLATFLCALTRAPLAVGYEDGTSTTKHRWNWGFQKAWNILLPPGPVQHEVKRNLQVGIALGSAITDLRPTLIVSDVDRDTVRRRLSVDQDTLLIALGLPASHGSKRWSTQHYLEVLAELARYCKIKPVIFADDETAEMAETIAKHYPQAIVGVMLPMLHIIGMLGTCRLFIGNDSGLGHVAAATGCPTVTIFNQVDVAGKNTDAIPTRFRPYGAISAIVQPAKQRPGCSDGCYHPEPHCILDVSSHSVAEVALRIIDGSYRRPEELGVLEEAGPLVSS